MIAILNQITATALPNHEWHKYGPSGGWHASYHLVARGEEDETPQSKWLRGGLAEDAFAALERALTFPTDDAPQEGSVTMSFAEFVSLNNMPGDTGRHPIIKNGNPTQDIYLHQTGNLAYLREYLEFYRAMVNHQFGHGPSPYAAAEEVAQKKPPATDLTPVPA